MIDFGLLASMIVAVGVPALVANRWPLRSYDPPVKVLDVALVPIGAGLLVGRLVAVALDDPRSLTSVADLMIIRSGVELWPGVAVAVAVVAVAARRERADPVIRLADAAPLVLAAYACYEAACPLRGGCFGPAAPVGLQPPGLTTTMVPVGMLMGVVVAAGAVAIWRHADRWPAPSEPLTRGDAAVVLSAAVLVVAATRAVGSIWLPHVGVGLTRQHQTSIAVAAVSAAALLTLLRLGHHRPGVGLATREDI